MLPGAEGITRPSYWSQGVGCSTVLTGSCSLGQELWQCCAALSDNFLLIFQLEAHVIFEGNKIFQAELELWGVRSCLL